MNLSSSLLKSFKITEAYHVYNTFHIKYEKVRAADYYKLEIMDSNADLVYMFNTKEHDLTFIVDNMEYNKSYSLSVFAYDKEGNYQPAKSSYDFVFDDPTINKEEVLLKDQDYKLLINGNLNDKDYMVNIFIDNELVKSEKLDKNEYKIPSSYYINQEKMLYVTITCDGILVDSVNLYNNMNPISDIVIDTPTENTTIIHNDLSVIFHGGDNAKEYRLNLYKNNKFDRAFTTKKRKIILSSDIFNAENNYRLEIIGTYGDYSKSASVNFAISGRDKLKPVYINVNPEAVKKGSSIVLKQPEGANIYYTLNGDDPNTNGILYSNPIIIDNSCVLKTVAKTTLKDDSIVSTYNLNVIDKNNIKIYISPSNQGGNPGVHEVGFTNEKQEMNAIADHLINKLKEYPNVTVYRNNPAGNINQWNNDANYLGVDFKLAIHSNASEDHTSYGVETWVDSEESNTYSIASLIQDAMIEMYPYKNREGYNRGVKYAHGEIGEANDMYVRNGILIEVAHHDEIQDAKWIKENEKAIGEKMAEVILTYFQVTSD